MDGVINSLSSPAIAAAMRPAPDLLPRPSAGVLRRLAAAVLVLLLVHPVSAAAGAPQNLRGSYSPSTGVVTLAWEPPNNAPYVYHVWRDDVYDGSTAELRYSDNPPGDVPDPAYVYLVRAAHSSQPDEYGEPAVVGVPTVTCEVLSITTTWSPPYLTVTLHGECLKGSLVYDKSVTYDLGSDGSVRE